MEMTPINYDTPTLLAARRHIRIPQTFATTRIFSKQRMSSTKKFRYEEIVDGRPCADWTVQGAPGQKVVALSSDTKEFQTGVIRLEENIDPEKFAVRIAGLVQGTSSSLTDYERWTPERAWAVYVMEVIKAQKIALSNLLEKSAWELLSNATLNIAGPGRDPILMDMGRHADLTRVLAGTDAWDMSGDPTKDITNVKTTMRGLKFGGPLSLVVMGWAAWHAYENNAKNKALRDKNFYALNIPVKITIGARTGAEFELMGYEANGSPIIVFRDTYDKKDLITGIKTSEPFIDPRDVLFVGPNAGGEQFYSPVWNFKNKMRPSAFFQSMNINERGTEQYIAAECNPIMVLLGANNTARIRVVENKEID